MRPLSLSSSQPFRWSLHWHFSSGALCVLRPSIIESIRPDVCAQAFTNRPGPTTYYSHFAGLVLSTSLLFQSFQRLLLTTRRVGKPTKRWLDACTCAYWLTLTLSGLICTVAYGFTPKADCIGIEVLVFLVGLTSLPVLIQLRVWPTTDLLDRSSPARDKSNKLPLMPQTGSLHAHSARDLGDFHTGSHIACLRGKRMFRNVNRVFKMIHWILSVLSISGSINLALQYRFTNPGTIIEVVLPTGEKQSLNYNCTLTPSNGTALPTIWFEGDAAHGVVDFLGVQTALLAHGRNSCTYDPPNFGWSDRLSSNLSNFTTSLPALWEKLGVDEEDRILAGWGGGTEVALHHAISYPNRTRGLVIMDTSPSDIEYLDAKQ